MCGRYTLSVGHEALARAFLAEFADELQASWKPRYNITPGTGIVAILEDRNRGGLRKAEVLHWGLVPGWAKDPEIGYKLINARAETIAEKPSYRDAFRYRRCLVPANGFYEWDRRKSPRQPYYFHPAKGEVMAMAGVWEHWLHPSGSEILSVALITRNSDKTVGKIHNRMPLMLPPKVWDTWLDTHTVKPAIEDFLKAAEPDDYLAGHRVSLAVNKGEAEGEELIRAIPEKGALDETGGQQLDLF
ncbi:MAG TPA: SOS response-associated peptidase [Oceanipulchritudo sp.]|nr:SOS response-associated peptidase [Oceanipulchritudo sp.]